VHLGRRPSLELRGKSLARSDRDRQRREELDKPGGTGACRSWARRSRGTEGSVVTRRACPVCPNPDTSTNFRSRFTVQGTRRPAKPRPTEPPPITKLLAKAEAWQGQLDRGLVKSRAAIAAREGVSATPSGDPGVDPVTATGDAAAEGDGAGVEAHREDGGGETGRGCGGAWLGPRHLKFLGHREGRGRPLPGARRRDVMSRHRRRLRCSEGTRRSESGTS
jgi:hypothetical protein